MKIPKAADNSFSLSMSLSTTLAFKFTPSVPPPFSKSPPITNTSSMYSRATISLLMENNTLLISAYFLNFFMLFKNSHEFAMARIKKIETNIKSFSVMGIVFFITSFVCLHPPIIRKGLQRVV